MRADSREENSSSLGRDGGDGTSTPTPLNVCPQRVLTSLKYLPLGEKPWKVPLWKGKNWTSISVFWHKFLSSWRMVSVGCQCHSLEERNLTCDQKWGKCTLQAQDFCMACYKFVGFEFFFFLMNLIIQVWILEQVLWYGGILRHAAAQMLFPLRSDTAVGKFFLSWLSNFWRDVKDNFLLQKICISLHLYNCHLFQSSFVTLLWGSLCYPEGPGQGWEVNLWELFRFSKARCKVLHRRQINLWYRYRLGMKG